MSNAAYTRRVPIGEAIKWHLHDGRLSEALIGGASKFAPLEVQNADWWGEVEIEGTDFVVSIYVEGIDELRCWDNEGVSIDRFTVVWPGGPYLAMDSKPFHPQGFGQHGEGAEYEPETEEVDGRLRSYLGWMIEFGDLPPDCQKCVIRDLALCEEEEDGLA